MDIKPLRTHPKMTKNLLDQIDTLQRSNHTSDEICLLSWMEQPTSSVW